MVESSKIIQTTIDTNKAKQTEAVKANLIKNVDEVASQSNRRVKPDTLTTNNKQEDLKMNESNVGRENKVGVIGTGAGGGNVASLSTQFGFVTGVVNTSMSDTINLNVSSSFIIPNANGSGQETSRAKEKFIAEIGAYDEYIQDNFIDCDTIFVVATGGGGTGAGIAAMQTRYLQDNYEDKNVVCIIMQGSINEPIKSQENMREVFDELDEAAVPYMVFDNGLSSSDSIDDVYKTINSEVVESIRLLSRAYFKSNNRQNIDPIDFNKLFIDRKRMVVVTGKFNRKVTNKLSYEEQMIQTIHNSTQIGISETDDIEALGVFLNVDDDVYNNIDINFSAIHDEFGESYEMYKQLQDDSTVDAPDFGIIMTGLEPCFDRYKLINDRIEDHNAKKVAKLNLKDMKRAESKHGNRVVSNLDKRQPSTTGASNKDALSMFTKAKK